MAAGIGHFIASNLQLLELQSEVSERLPQSEKFEPLFWSFPRLMQLRRRQRNLLLQSPRISNARRFGIIGFVVFLLGVAVLLFGLRGVYNL